MTKPKIARRSCDDAPPSCPMPTNLSPDSPVQSSFVLLEALYAACEEGEVRLSIYLCPECSEKAGRRTFHWFISSQRSRALARHIEGLIEYSDELHPAIEVLKTPWMMKSAFDRALIRDRASEIVEAGRKVFADLKGNDGEAKPVE